MNGGSVTPDQYALLRAASAISESGNEEATAELATVAGALGIEWAFGKITYAGQSGPKPPTQFAPGDFAVTFAIDQGSVDTGVYASAWPKWSYKIAKAALIANKRVLVTYAPGKGGPVGHSLESVSLTTL
jgi:hypothetical protein